MARGSTAERPALEPTPIQPSQNGNGGEPRNNVVDLRGALDSGEHDLDETLSAICERAQELTRAHGASILVAEEEALRCVAASGIMKPYVGTTLPVDGTLVGWTLRDGGPGLCSDARTDPRAHADFCREHGVRAMLAVPVPHAGQVIGVIQVLATRPDAFDEDDARTLDLVALGFSAAVSNVAALDAKRAQVEALGRFQKIFDGAPIGLMRLDPEGRVVEANVELEQLLGYSVAELGKLSVADISDPRDLPRCVELYEECVAGKRDAYEVEKRYIRKDGNTIWARARATVLERDATGIPVFTMMMVEDITDRKLAELALRENTELSRLVESLRQFQTIFDGAPIGLARVETGGRIVEANEALQRMLGHSAAELEGKSLQDFTHLDDLDVATRSFAGLRSGAYDAYQIETRYVRSDSELLWCQVSATVLERNSCGESQFAIVMVEDITQRKFAELALQRKTERLSQIAETQRDIAAAGLDLDAVMDLVTERAAALTASDGASINLIDGDDVVARTATGVAAGVLGSRRPLADSVTRHAARSGRALLIEQADSDRRMDPRLVDATGERSHICVPLFQGGNVVGSLAVMSRSETRRLDEEDRQTMELLGVVLSSAISSAAEFEAKRQQVEALTRFETIYQGAPIGIGMLSLDGRLIDTNAAMRAITGFTADKLAQTLVSEYTFPEDVAQLRSNFFGLVAGDHDSSRDEYRLIARNGETVWVDAALAVVRDREGEICGAITMAQDISERRAAEEQLRQSQKIEAIGQLSAGIAHDFNNLLMGVLGYAELARGDVAEGTRVASCLDRIIETGDRAASMTKQLLAFGRRQTLQPRELDLNELVCETLSLLTRLLGEHIEIVSRLEESLPPLRADPTQIQQVLLNLAINARDAMPGGGVLTITTRPVVLAEEQIPAGLELEPGSYILLSVEDTGEGMTSDVRERIFEPFFTTKEIGEGTGLGLPSVHGIVKQSRGDIEVSSRPGEGTAFRVYLPATEPASTKTEASAKCRILVVEDTDVVRELLHTLLDQAGYEVLAAADPQAALELAGREERFDVLLSDVGLQGMSGPELADRLRAIQPGVRVLYMSGYQHDDRVDPESLIAKPFSSEELLGWLESKLAPPVAA